LPALAPRPVPATGARAEPVRVLVVDPAPMFGDALGRALAAEGIECRCVARGEEALDALSRRDADVLLLELRLPDMDGLALLRELRRDRAGRDTPVIVLTSASDRDTVVRAVALRVSAYFRRDQATLERVVGQTRQAADQVRRARARSSAGGCPGGGVPTPPPSGAPARDPRAGLDALRDVSSVLTKSEITGFLEGCDKLRGFSPAIAHVLAVTSRPDSSLADIVRAVSRDPVLAVRLLRIANSAAYARGKMVDSIATAVMRIGQENIQQAVVSIGVVERFSSVVTARVNFASFWEHSIAVALIAAAIARQARVVSPDLMFTAGILHDLGRLVYLELLGDVYVEVLDVASRLDLPLEAVERRMLHVTHAEAIEPALRSWGLPRALARPIACHHLPAHLLHRHARDQTRDAAALALANRLAHAAVMGSSGNDMVYPLDGFGEVLGLAPEGIERALAEARAEAEDMRLSLLAVSAGISWPHAPAAWRDALDRPFRPLHASTGPGSSPAGLLCQSLRDDAPGAPNVALVSLASPAGAQAAAEALRQAEREADTPPLPAIVLTPSPQALLPVEDDRAVRHLVMPASLERLGMAVREVVGVEGD
jgi:HD-like signal output (HDOD) protein/ActR/RegA family two-component response regulator